MPKKYNDTVRPDRCPNVDASSDICNLGNFFIPDLALSQMPASNRTS